MKSSKKPILWITDPWNTLDHPRDTTLRLMEEACHLKLPQAWCDVKSIRLNENGTRLDARWIDHIAPERTSDSVVWKTQPKEFGVGDFSKILFRTDPPVDLAYLHPLQMLAIGAQSSKKVEFVNPLEVLFLGNEKMEAALMQDMMPPSIVSSEWEQLRAFGRENQRTVLKPLHQAQSHGIELLDWRKEDSRAHAKMKLSVATQHFQLPILLQSYLEGIADGETRLWFLDGKLLACAKKLPVSGDFRVDIDRGSQLAPARLTKKEKTVAAKISRHLIQRSIRLAAVDLIEGWITDFNFTSPGLITQMESLLEENLAKKIVSALAH